MSYTYRNVSIKIWPMPWFYTLNPGILIPNDCFQVQGKGSIWRSGGFAPQPKGLHNTSANCKKRSRRSNSSHAQCWGGCWWCPWSPHGITQPEINSKLKEKILVGLTVYRHFIWNEMGKRSYSLIMLQIYG